MKYLVKFFVVTFLVLICTHASAEQKIVYLDMKFILNNSKAGKDAQDFLKNSLKKNEKLFSNKIEELKKKERDLLAKKTAISKEEYKKQTDELRKKVTEFQTQRGSFLEKITKQRADARQKLLEEIDLILNDYIKKNEISLAIDKKYTLGGMIDLDVTNIIIEKLNNKFPSLNLK